MNKQLRVLIVEDSKLASAAILRSLSEGGLALAEPLVVETPESLAEALTQKSWDVVISDYVMPAFNGTQALKVFQRFKLDIPFICVSGEIGEEKAAEVIRSGANNYVSKSHLSRLGKVVEFELATAVERRHRRQVAEATAHLAAIVEGTDDAIFSRDMSGTILSWNSAAERMFGYTAAEAVGKPMVSLIVPPDKVGELDEIVAKLKRGERIERMETARLHKSGATINVSKTISPIKDEEGRVIGASIIARDITERLRLERERLDLIKDLRGALAQVKQLSGLLPICANCKRIRDERGAWEAVEVYVHEHSQADFTHGICPDCAQELYPELYEKMNKKD